ncbi:MAG TPA: L-rhamnose isomerase [Firmicutes bacterium]|nr:L-rhamnose isomerase [Bacillota bacterium]
MKFTHENRLEMCLAGLPKSVDFEKVMEQLLTFHVETPSWGYGTGGTRFHTMRKPGEPRCIKEKLADAAQVHKHTGITPTVAIHIPWDKVSDWGELSSYASSLGLALGAVNPNLFQEDDYLKGSLSHREAAVRARAMDHIKECIDIMNTVGSRDLSLWLADGTNYPGQDNFRDRLRRMADSLAQVYALLGERQRLLIEYKPFEPAFYHTDIPDWGLATLYAEGLGPKAFTLVDLGHHLHGTNIEYIVAILLSRGKLGGFHFNNRKYADDDLTTGSINPYEVFLIFNEIVAAQAEPGAGGEGAGGEGAGGEKAEIAYMIDQSHYIKPSIEAMIQSVVNIQRAYAKALIVDRERLEEAREAGDMIEAEECLTAAFNYDVDPLLVEARRRMGVPDNPLAAFRRSGYMKQVEKERA